MLACKDHRVRLLDPRSPSPIEGPSHDSPRPVHIVWCSETHFVTTGFARGAGREVRLLEVTSSDLRLVAKQSLEMSPAALFPHFDCDTGILFLHSKGERIIQAFEVRAQEGPKAFTRLPSFEHSTLQLSVDFLPKKYCDTSKVEVSVAYRLTDKTVERVGFAIPRARVEYFQDDIYLPAVDVGTPSMTIQEWQSGANTPQPRLNLNTRELPLLSEAPPTKAAVSTRNKIAAGPQKTDSERAKEQMDRLWSKAQDDGASDDSEGDIPASGRVPEDDDW